MRLIVKYLSEYKAISITAPLFKMLEAIFELLVPLVMASIIDVGIKNRDTGYIFRMSLLLLFFAAAGLLVAITAQYFAALAAVRSVRKMRGDLFSHIMSFSEASMDTFGASTLITRLTSDLTQVQNGINMFLRLFLRSPFIVIGATVMAFLIHAKAALIFVGVIGLLSFFVGVIMRTTLPMYKNTQSILDQLLLRVSENLEGVRVIRAFATGDREREKFHAKAKELLDWQLRSGRIQVLLNPLTYVTVNLGIVLLLWYASGLVDNGLLLQGEVVALCNYMSQILVELVKFANLVMLVTRGLASAGRIEMVMAYARDERKHLASEKNATSGKSSHGEVLSAAVFDTATSEQPPAIAFSDVSFAYGEAAKGEAKPDLTLEHISFAVKKGDTLGIVGGTGAGKSTVARLIRHAYDASGGSIRLFGRDARSFSDEEIARRIANVPQKASLFAGDIASNLRMANPSVDEETMWAALSKAQAKDFVLEKEGGLSAKVQKRGANFSGGQRQRLTIARALCVGADILILDDCASALDLATEARLKAELDAMKDVTKIIISQRASSVKNADKIAVIEDGWCVGLGTHDELLRKCDVYKEIYYAQFPEERDIAAANAEPALSATV